MRKKKALIVGGSGQIGLYLSKYLLKKNYLVYVTTRNLKKNPTTAVIAINQGQLLPRYFFEVRVRILVGHIKTHYIICTDHRLNYRLP